VIEVDKCLPLMEITWNRFTFLHGVIQTDNANIQSKVKTFLSKRKIKVSSKLKEYESRAKKKYKALF